VTIFICAGGFSDAFDNRGGGDVLAFRLPGAIMNRDSSPAAEVFIIGALIGILNSAPPADVVQKDGGENDLPALDIPNHLRQSVAVLDINATLAPVRILFDDLHPMAFGILPDDVHLVAGQVRRMRGCSHVSGDTDRW